MEILHDATSGLEPVDVDTEARGDWEDQAAELYAWQADEERADYLASLGPRGLV